MCIKHDKELSHAFRALDSAVLTYNEQLLNQELVPSTNRRARGIDFRVTVNKDGQSREEIIGTDIAVRRPRSWLQACTVVPAGAMYVGTSVCSAVVLVPGIVSGAGVHSCMSTHAGGRS